MEPKNQTNSTVISDHFTNDKLERFSKSDYRRATNISKRYRQRTVKKEKSIKSNLIRITNLKCPMNIVDL